MPALRTRLLLLLAATCGGCAAAPLDLCAGGRLLAQAVAGYDAAHHQDTCKVYHRLFAPDGRLVSKDLGGEYPHHKGLFVGWNQLRHGGRSWDFWHCPHGESQRLVAVEAGARADEQRLAIDWIDGDGRVLVHERRQLRATALPQQNVVDCHIELQAATGAVELDGDPQHSGVQFRSAFPFAPADAAVRFLRPAAARPIGDDVWLDCSWVAGVLPLPGGEVTVLHGDAPGNPRPNRYSTRAYGRFGSTFRHLLQPGQTLRLDYRLSVAAGARSAAQCAADAAAFAAGLQGGSAMRGSDR